MHESYQVSTTTSRHEPICATHSNIIMHLQDNSWHCGDPCLTLFGAKKAHTHAQALHASPAGATPTAAAATEVSQRHFPHQEAAPTLCSLLANCQCLHMSSALHTATTPRTTWLPCRAHATSFVGVVRQGAATEAAAAVEAAGLLRPQAQLLIWERSWQLF